MDPRRAELLQRQIDEANGGKPDDFESWRKRTQATLETTLGAEHPVTKRFDGVRYGLTGSSASTPVSAFAEARERGVQTAITILESAMHDSESEEHSIDGFHPWVSAAATQTWDDGHHREALAEAANAVELRIKTKLGVDLTGYPLVTEAFNPNEPEPGRSRLRFPRLESDTDAGIYAHQGAMHFAQGCILRIRSLIHHQHGDLGEQEAFECLASLSLLARWADEAMVVSGTRPQD